jgi:co-chaperonin GroES (HSP10)
MINNNMEKGEKMKINLKKGDIFMYKSVNFFVIGKYIGVEDESLISEVIYDSDTRSRLKFRVGQVVYHSKKSRVTKIKKDELPLYLVMQNDL